VGADNAVKQLTFSAMQTSNLLKPLHVSKLSKKHNLPVTKQYSKKSQSYFCLMCNTKHEKANGSASADDCNIKQAAEEHAQHSNN